MLRKVLYALLASLLIIQIIRPDKNVSTEPSINDISNIHPMNLTVKTALQRACYDCHSNNTNYPWYSNIQPIGWWLQHHIDEGREHLNFHEMAAYTPKKLDHKLEEMQEAINDGWMPLSSYKLSHQEAVLTSEEKAAINGWIKQIRSGTDSSHNHSEHSVHEKEAH